MTPSTQGTITGYFPRALIWIGNVFVYHTCKTVRITYKYVINQNSFPSVLVKTKVFYCPVPLETYFDLLPALPLNNCILLHYSIGQAHWCVSMAVIWSIYFKLFITVVIIVIYHITRCINTSVSILCMLIG